MNKKILITILTILGPAIIAGGFYLWLQKKAELRQNNAEKQIVKQDKQEMEKEENEKNGGDDRKNENNQEQNNQDDNSEELDFEKIDTSNWKTYRNEELGFEVKYPEGWEIKCVNKKNRCVFVNKTNQKYFFEGVEEKNILVLEVIDDLNKQKELIEAIKSEMVVYDNCRTKDINIGKYSAKFYSCFLGNKLLLKHNNKLFYIDDRYLGSLYNSILYNYFAIIYSFKPIK